MNLDKTPLLISISLNKSKPLKIKTDERVAGWLKSSSCIHNTKTIDLCTFHKPISLKIKTNE